MTLAAFPRAEDAPAVSPKTTDASTLTLPIAWVWVIVVAVGGSAVGQSLTLAAMRSDVRELVARNEARDKADEEIKTLNQKYLDQRFAALEAKIDAAGLRNANMALAQELQKQRK